MDRDTFLKTSREGAPASHFAARLNEAAEALFKLYCRADTQNRRILIQSLIERTADYAVLVEGWTKESTEEFQVTVSKSRMI